MKSNLLIIFLIVIILLLLVPVSSQLYYCEHAFTIDNLIRLNLVSK